MLVAHVDLYPLEIMQRHIAMKMIIYFVTITNANVLSKYINHF